MANTSHKPTEATRAQVEALAGYGIQQEQIAQYLAIDAKTLRKHYRKELDGGATKANVMVARALHKNATDNANVAAQIFWMKTRCGWKETAVHEHTGASGGPIETSVGTPEQFRKVAEEVAAKF